MKTLCIWVGVTSSAICYIVSTHSANIRSAEIVMFAHGTLWKRGKTALLTWISWRIEEISFTWLGCAWTFRNSLARLRVILAIIWFIWVRIASICCVFAGIGCVIIVVWTTHADLVMIWTLAASSLRVGPIHSFAPNLTTIVVVCILAIFMTVYGDI